MATVTARKVDDDDYHALAEIAYELGHSVSEELRLMIAERVRKRRADAAVSDFLAFTKAHPLKLPKGMNSLDLLREERNSW